MSPPIVQPVATTVGNGGKIPSSPAPRIFPTAFTDVQIVENRLDSRLERRSSGSFDRGPKPALRNHMQLTVTGQPTNPILHHPDFGPPLRTAGIGGD